MINVGIIGLGPHWEVRYRSALDSLRSRIRISAVYDPVAGKAEQAAREVGAVAYQGLTSLARSSVRALLLLDPSWHGPQTLALLYTAGKPIYVAGTLGSDAVSLRRLHDTSAAGGLTLMPELSRRYAPTTHRLQELMATRIGRPRRITVEASLGAQQDSTLDPHTVEVDHLIGLLDWCRYIAGSNPVSVLSRNGGTSPAAASPSHSIEIEFAKRRGGGSGTVAQLRIHNPPGDTVAASRGRSVAFRQEIECERGTAVVTSPVEIAWASDDSSCTEQLTGDRPDVEVMLDHFARRVVGGLIPVADLGDVYRCLALIRAAEESRRTGLPVVLNGSD